MKKLLSWLLIAIGLFFTTGVLALVSTSTYSGAIFFGILAIVCFFGAYKIYPKEKKAQIKKDETLKKNTPVNNIENTTPIENNGKIVVSSNILNDLNNPKYIEVAHNIVDYYETIKSLSLIDLDEDDAEDLENLQFKIHEDMRLIPNNVFESSTSYFYNPLACMLSILLDESDYLTYALYYIEDRDTSWIEDIDYKIEDIEMTFEFLQDSPEE